MFKMHSTFGVRLAIVIAMVSGTLVSGAQQAGDLNLPQKLVSKLMLGYIASEVHLGTPQADAWAGGSPGSVKLANAYQAEDLAACVQTMTQGVDAAVVHWQLAGPETTPANKAEAASSDKFAQVRGFKVEITGSTGKEVDTAWESVSGGDMVIEVTETTIGSDQFSKFNLRGAFRALEGPLNDLADCDASGVPCEAQAVKPRIQLLGYGGKLLAAYGYEALDSVFLENQLLILWAKNKQLRVTLFEVAELGKDGSLLPAAPKIFLALQGVKRRSGAVVAIANDGRTEVGRNTVPYINSVPSVPLYNFGARNIPLLGSISVGFTIVPPAAPPGPGDVMIEYNGQQSNRFPFTVN